MRASIGTRTRTKSGISLALVLGLCLAGGCEPTDITAPTGSQLTLVATPASVFIDQDAGLTMGTSQIVAQLVDAGGLPLSGIPMFFSTTGGFLGSVNNICIGATAATSTCSRTGTDCDPEACPVVPPIVLETNDNGIVLDTLTLRLIEDPDSVTVTAHATTFTATVTVTKNINLGPDDPKAIFTVDPDDGQRIGLPFALNGSASTFDPQVDLTCFQWEINSDNDDFDFVARGPNLSTLDVVLGEIGLLDPKADEQDVVITLRVSDESEIPCTLCGTESPVPACTPASEPDPDLFSNFSANQTYQIRCDTTDPDVDIGPNLTASLSAECPVNINVTAIAEDAESSDLIYLWDCGTLGTPAGPIDGQTVTCVYGSPGTSTITVSVQNECDGVTQDSISVTIVGTCSP